MQKVLYGEILDPEPTTEKAAADEKRVRDGFKDKVRRAAVKIPFIEDVVAAYFCALDPATSARTRYILFGALAYFIMPLDWVPDFLLVFGFTDDIAVLTAAISAVRASMRDVHFAAAKKLLANPSPDAESAARAKTSV